jgi:hypothetical protein
MNAVTTNLAVTASLFERMRRYIGHRGPASLINEDWGAAGTILVTDRAV